MTEYLGAGARQFGFMLRGLRELEPRLEALNIPFFLVKVRQTWGLHPDAAVRARQAQMFIWL